MNLQLPAMMVLNGVLALALCAEELEEKEGVTSIGPDPIYETKVVVTAPVVNEGLLNNYGLHSTSFDQVVINRNTSTSLADVLRFEPGVSVDEGARGITNIRIRGVGDDRVMMSIDGAPLPTAYRFGTFLSASREYFDIDAMKSVDVVKGPASILYGSGALAGAVILQTKDPEDYIKAGKRFGGETKVGYNSDANGHVLAGAIAAHLTPDLSALVRFTLRKQYETRNYYGRAFGESLLGEQRRNPEASEKTGRNIMTKWIYRPNDHHSFTMSYDYYNSRSHDKLLSYFNLLTYNGYQYHGYYFDQTQRQQLSLRHEFKEETALFDTGFWQIYGQNNKIRQSYYDQRDHLRRKINIVRERISSFDNQQIGIMTEFSKTIDNHKITYGITAMEKKIKTLRLGHSINSATGQSVEIEVFPNKSFPDTRIRDVAFFIQDTISLLNDRLVLIPGLRYDRHALRPKLGGIYEMANAGDEPPVPMTKGMLSKHFALLYHPSHEYTLHASYAEGFKTPNFSAVNLGYSSDVFGYLSKTNPHLNVETNRTYEIGGQFHGVHHSMAITGFYSAYNNFINEVNEIGRDPETNYRIFQATNLDKSYIYGVEAKAHMLVATTASGRGLWHFDMSAAYARGKEKKSKEPIDSIDPLRAVLGLSYTQSDRLFMAIKWNLTQSKSEKYISSALKKQGITRMPGSGTLDLMAEYKPQDNIAFNGGIYNITNKKYWDWGSRARQPNRYAVDRATKPGINVAIALKISF